MADSIPAARSIGFQLDISLLKKGKSAYLVILNSNPLEGIHHQPEYSVCHERRVL